MNQCSSSNNSYSYTCFSKKSLLNIAKNYNNLHKNDLINLALSKKKLHSILKTKFNNICNDNDEKCWSKQSNINIYRPDKPCQWTKNPTQWLNSSDIEKVMIQYQIANKDFKYVGTFPIDFESKTSLGNCISNEMCNINIEKIYKSKINKLGFVFNLDKHNQSGSHWVALYISLDSNSSNFGAYYYDSVANTIPLQIKKFMIHVKKSIQNITTKKFVLVKNKKRHQYKNTECGMFSIHFLINCLKNTDTKIDSIYNMNINDEYVEKFRNIYFKPNLTCTF